MKDRSTEPLLKTSELQVRMWVAGSPPRLAVPEHQRSWSGWRRGLRRSLRSLLALPPRATACPEITVTERFEKAGLRVQRLILRTSYDSPWEALVMERADSTGRRPGWVCLHGCLEGGMSSVTGLIDPSPGGRESLELCRGDYALQLALRGAVVLSFHFPGFASRSESGAVPEPGFLSSCLMVGRPYLGWCVANTLSAVSALRSWPRVDRHRVGVTGFSMGGTLSAMAGSLDSRIGAIAVSGRFPSWRERATEGRIGWLACVPGMAQRMDIADILAACVPRPLFVSQEVRGEPEKAQRLLAGVRRAYRSMKAGDRLAIHYDTTPCHRFIGRPLYDWVEALWRPQQNKRATKENNNETGLPPRSTVSVP